MRGNRGAGREEGADDVEVEDGAQGLCLHRLDSRHLAGDAAVVDEVRESAELGIDGLEHARDIVFVRHVALNGEGLAAGGRDIVDAARRRLGALLVVDGDIESARAGQPRDGGTDAPAASGDKQYRSLRQRRFFLHGVSPDARQKPVWHICLAIKQMSQTLFRECEATP